MKKIKLLLIGFLVFGCNPKEKVVYKNKPDWNTEKFKVELTKNDWQIIVNTLDSTNRLLDKLNGKDSVYNPLRKDLNTINSVFVNQVSPQTVSFDKRLKEIDSLSKIQDSVKK